MPHHSRTLPAHSAPGQEKAAPPPPASPAVSDRVSQLSRAEWIRRLLHILPGFLPIVLWYVPHRDPLSLDCRAWLALVIVSICVGTAIKYRHIARRGEQHNPACILGYALPVFLLLMFVPAHAELGLATLAILSVGDGTATLGGLLLRGPSLPWNPEKTWAGFLCFLVFATPWAAIVFWGEANPVLPFGRVFLCAGIATFAAVTHRRQYSRRRDSGRSSARQSRTAVPARLVNKSGSL